MVGISLVITEKKRVVMKTSMTAFISVYWHCDNEQAHTTLESTFSHWHISKCLFLTSLSCCFVLFFITACKPFVSLSYWKKIPLNFVICHLEYKWGFLKNEMNETLMLLMFGDKSILPFTFCDWIIWSSFYLFICLLVCLFSNSDEETV